MDLHMHKPHPYLTLHLGVRYDPCTGSVRMTEQIVDSAGIATLETTESFPADRPEALNLAMRRAVSHLVRIEEKRDRERRARA
jgi:hypothetical protein